MMWHKLFLCAVFLVSVSLSEGQAECPCKNLTLCKPLSTKPYKEVLAFVVNQVGCNHNFLNITYLTFCGYVILVMHLV